MQNVSVIIDPFASFSDQDLLDLSKKYSIKLLYGGESWLPVSFCGLSLLLHDHLNYPSPRHADDLYLQWNLNLDLNLADILQELASNSTSRVCSTFEGLNCDGRVFVSSLPTARPLVKDYKESAVLKSQQLLQLQRSSSETCKEACQFPGRALFSEEQKLTLLQSSINSLDMRTERRESDSESHQIDSEEESPSQSTSSPPLSFFTNVTKKFVTDGQCQMGWPLDRSQVFVLDELYSLSESLPTLPILLYCRLLPAVGQTDSSEMVQLQVEFLLDGRPQEAPVVMQVRRKAADKMILFVDLPRLPAGRPVGGEGEGQGQLSVSVSVFSPTDNLLFASLQAAIGFEFGSRDRRNPARRQVPSGFHAEMARLGRDQLFSLLNALDLTGVAVEVGVFKAEFALRMLKNWRGDRCRTDRFRYFNYCN